MTFSNSPEVYCLPHYRFSLFINGYFKEWDCDYSSGGRRGSKLKARLIKMMFRSLLVLAGSVKLILK